MFGRLKTAWKGLKIATQLRKAWKRGGGSATAGGAIALAVDPKPFGQFVFGVLAHFFPGFMASLPAESSVEVLGVLTAMLIGWLIGALKEEATDKVEQRGGLQQGASAGDGVTLDLTGLSSSTSYVGYCSSEVGGRGVWLSEFSF